MRDPAPEGSRCASRAAGPGQAEPEVGHGGPARPSPSTAGGPGLMIYEIFLRMGMTWAGKISQISRKVGIQSPS